MAGSLNQASLIGNLGRDPETRRLSSGDPVVNFRIATSETWTDKSTGEKKEQTEWHSVVIFNERLCEIAEKYLAKGSKVFVQGKIQTRKWQDKDGVDRYSTEIVLSKFDGRLLLIGDKGGSGPNREPESYGTTRVKESGSSYQRARDGGDDFGRGSGGGRPPLDDDIPFAPETRG